MEERSELSGRREPSSPQAAEDTGQLSSAQLSMGRRSGVEAPTICGPSHSNIFTAGLGESP